MLGAWRGRRGRRPAAAAAAGGGPGLALTDGAARRRAGAGGAGGGGGGEQTGRRGKQYHGAAWGRPWGHGLSMLPDGTDLHTEGLRAAPRRGI
jgi:hypothetical protein